jgi:hypothetical protein
MTSQPNQTEIQAFLQSDENQLLEQLGMRAAVATRDLKKSAELNPTIVADDVIAMGIKDDLKDLGKRILRRWERSAYDVFCGHDPDDAKVQNEVKKALGMGEVATIGVLSAALIGIGLMPALAPVLAAILVKKFFNPAYGEFCAYWKEKLPGTK